MTDSKNDTASEGNQNTTVNYNVEFLSNHQYKGQHYTAGSKVVLPLNSEQKKSLLERRYIPKPEDKDEKGEVRSVACFRVSKA